VLASYIISFHGPTPDAPGWVLDLSAFRHLAIVPAEPVSWISTLAMVAAGAAFATGGTVAYAGRDLQ